MELIWTPQALEDLIEIYVTIGLENETAAERFYTAIEARALMLIEFPRLGRRRTDVAAAARMLLEGPYLLLYELHPDTDEGPVSYAEIVRVVDGRRELNGLFDQ